MMLEIDSLIPWCQRCNRAKPHQHKEPLLVHPVPELPWSLVSADIFVWQSTQYLILADLYSGWIKMNSLRDLSAKTVIQKMKRHFSVHGIPCRLLADNDPQLSSREFSRFAEEWNFHHVTSSPHYPQSNGLVENAVKQAKNLLDTCKKDGSDPLLGLLNLRNVPRDQVLGSPMQRLMSRRTRCLLPVAKKLLAPRALNNKHVASHLKSKHMQQKAFYDRGAKPLPPLNPQQVVRLQTSKGYEKVGIVKRPTADPRSYIVDVGEREYRRNRRHLLAVPERAPTPLEETNQNVPAFPAAANQIASPFSSVESPPVTLAKSPVPGHSPLSPRVRPETPVKSPSKPSTANVSGSSCPSCANAQRPLVVTRSGRISKPNTRYQDFVT